MNYIFRAAKGLSVCLCGVVLLTLGGCMSYNPNTDQSNLRQSEMMQFSGGQPITLNNVAASGKIKIGSGFGWKAHGDKNAFTESCIKTLKREFGNRGIQVSTGAEKSLDLEVVQASIKQGAWMASAIIHLNVKTGGGLEREYEGRQGFGTWYALTSAIENAMGHCIEQMLNDPDVVAYISK